MADLVRRYHTREVTRKGYGGAETKAYRYVPVNEALSPDLQAVYPYHLMERVIARAEVIAVAHTVTEMRPIKHAFQAGIKAEQGVEF